jgi:hypothetical protein
MTKDIDIAHPAASPAFFLHLGDVNYYDNTDSGYHEQFYVPYKLYPGKIIAIPGNHDSELFKYDGQSTGQTKTLQAFQRNFVQPVPSVPPAAGSTNGESAGGLLVAERPVCGHRWPLFECGRKSWFSLCAIDWNKTDRLAQSHSERNRRCPSERNSQGAISRGTPPSI